MAFRATKSSEYDRARNVARDLKRLSETRKAESAAGDISASVLRELVNRLVAADAAFAEVASVPGIADYAQAQEGDAAYDVAAEFNAMRAAVQATRDWILNAVPQSGGFVLVEAWDASGVSQRTFTPTQTAGLRTQLDSLMAAID